MKHRIRTWFNAVSLFTVLAAACAPPCLAQMHMIGIFSGHGDVGSPQLAGSASYDAETQTYTITGAGTNMWADRDEYHFVWKRLSGDFILRTRAEFLGDGVDPHRKIGWIIRKDFTAASPYVDIAVHGDGLTSMQFRRTPAAETEQVESTLTSADVIQLERKGGVYTMAVARFGEPLVVSEPLTGIDLGDEVYVGLFVCSHNPEVRETAVFRNTRIIVPAPDDFTPYRDYIGSNLEVMDVETGHRRIVFQSPISLQAPNWTLDGKALIYNSSGLLYRFDLDQKMPIAIDTDFATRNNNDHVLSFDGTMLAISHHSADHSNQSIVYTVPVEGGTPRQVTDQGPSYLHGWSPDGRYLTYTGGRDGEYDIYVIPTEGGEEIRLTTAEALDDGPEYSPDGQYIYFNSTRSGMMELWRMKPDGSEQEQLTDDAYNNWFPHLSPDGEWIVFVSYMDDVDPADHPFYKRVYLRIMPVDGSAPPRILAYVYGGQGTINVPSWSPDGRRVAFVSNTAMQ